MRVTLLGTGGSAGVPMIGGADGRGEWGVCDPAESRNVRTRASIAIDGGGEGCCWSTRRRTCASSC